jgi:hypothetical protein
MCLKCGHTTVDPYKIQENNNKIGMALTFAQGLTGMLGSIWTCYAADQNSNGGGGTTVKSSKETEESVEEKPVDTSELQKDVEDI